MTIEQIIAELSKPIPKALIHALPAKGSPSYIRHQDVKMILNRKAPGWCGEIMDQGVHNYRVYLKDKDHKPTGEVVDESKVWVKYRITIPTSNGPVYRESFGHEDSEDPDSLYGDPWSNAEAMAFKRCAAWFGLGLKDLYKSDVAPPTLEEGARQAIQEEPVKEEPAPKFDMEEAARNYRSEFGTLLESSTIPTDKMPHLRPDMKKGEYDLTVRYTRGVLRSIDDGKITIDDLDLAPNTPTELKDSIQKLEKLYA